MSSVAAEKEHHLGSSGLYVAEYLAASPVTVILVPPLFEEHPRTRTLLVNTARYLASSGIRAIRFDYAGTGLSASSTAHLSPQSTIRDLELVCNYADSVHSSKLLLVGFRYGAHAAIQYRRYSNQKIPCLLWEPVTDLPGYFASLLKIALVNQLVVLGEIRENTKALEAKLECGSTLSIDGYPVTPEFYRQCKSVPQSQIAEALSANDTRAVFWKNKHDHAYFQRLQIPSEFLTGIRASWENIRFIESRPNELLRVTREWGSDHAA